MDTKYPRQVALVGLLTLTGSVFAQSDPEPNPCESTTLTFVQWAQCVSPVATTAETAVIAIGAVAIGIAVTVQAFKWTRFFIQNIKAR